MDKNYAEMFEWIRTWPDADLAGKDDPCRLINCPDGQQIIVRPVDKIKLEDDGKLMVVTLQGEGPKGYPHPTMGELNCAAVVYPRRLICQIPDGPYFRAKEVRPLFFPQRYEQKDGEHGEEIDLREPISESPKICDYLKSNGIDECGRIVGGGYDE